MVVSQLPQLLMVEHFQNLIQLIYRERDASFSPFFFVLSFSSLIADTCVISGVNLLHWYEKNVNNKCFIANLGNFLLQILGIWFIFCNFAPVIANYIIMEYISRYAEKDIERALRSVGAVLVVGPKFCGKTTTSMRFQNSFVKLNTNSRIKLARLNPMLALNGERPRLID